MKKYFIRNIGCDDSTDFVIELSDEELKTVIKLFDENNKNSTYLCQPEAYIYEYDENKSAYDYAIPLNKIQED